MPIAFGVHLLSPVGGLDYESVTSEVDFFPGGDMTVSVPVNLLTDSVVEPPQTFSLRLEVTDNSSVILSPAEVTVNVIDRDSK